MFAKERTVPQGEIRLALERIKKFKADPERPTFHKRDDHARPEDKTLGYLYDRYIGDDPELIAEYEKSRADSAVASDIYKLAPRPGCPSGPCGSHLGPRPRSSASLRTLTTRATRCRCSVASQRRWGAGLR